MSLICAARRPEKARESLGSFSRIVSILNNSDATQDVIPHTVGIDLLPINFITLGCHNEIVFVQATDLMCPPVECYLPPLCDDQRMMIFLLGNRANFVREL